MVVITPFDTIAHALIARVRNEKVTGRVHRDAAGQVGARD